MIKISVVEKLTDRTIIQTVACPEQCNSIIDKYTEVFPGEYYEIIIVGHNKDEDAKKDFADTKGIISSILRPLLFFIIPVLNIVFIYILVHSIDMFSITLIIILSLIMIMGGILIMRSGD